MYKVVYFFPDTVYNAEVQKFAGVHSDANNRCRACWKTLTWLDNWKRALLYVVLSVGCFVRLSRVWLTAISGLVFITVAYTV